jgi:surface polysaccharide O-acyltransferase-like enzyme
LVFTLLGFGAAAVQVTTGWWDGQLGTDSVGPFKWFWMLALGALIAQADTRARKGVVCGGLASVAALAYLGHSLAQNVFANTDLFFFGSALLLIWARTLPVPRFLHRPLVVVASSTLFIYITHISILKRMASLHIPGLWAFELVASLAAGILTTIVWNIFVSRVTRLWAVLRRGKPGTAASEAQSVFAAPAE